MKSTIESAVNSNTLTIPLFPLHTVLFPGGVLPLRIFEPRYLDMISQCLRTGTGIGVVLISDGQEVGKAADIFDIGTLTEITYFNKRSDGLLGVTLRGKQRFNVIESHVQNNQSILAEIELLPPESETTLPDRYRNLAVLARQIIEELGPPYNILNAEYENATWVTSRLAELLPIALKEKQNYLAMDDPFERLEALAQSIARLRMQG